MTIEVIEKSKGRLDVHSPFHEHSSAKDKDWKAVVVPSSHYYGPAPEEMSEDKLSMET